MDELSAHEAAAIEEARRLSMEGDVSAAERIFHTIINSKNQDPLNLWLFGYEFIKHKLHEKAVTCFQRAIELDERCVPAWRGLGHALAGLEQWDGAEAAFRRRLGLAESANHYVFLASVLLRQSRYEEVLSCCERALQLDDRQVDALLNQGFAYSALGSHEKALGSCRRAVSIDSEYDEAYIGLGVMLSRANDLEAATEAFQRAIDINPQSAPAHRELGLIWFFKGDSVLAKSYLQAGDDLDRGQPREAVSGGEDFEGDKLNP